MRILEETEEDPVPVQRPVRPKFTDSTLRCYHLSATSVRFENLTNGRFQLHVKGFTVINPTNAQLHVIGLTHDEKYWEIAVDSTLATFLLKMGHPITTCLEHLYPLINEQAIKKIQNAGGRQLLPYFLQRSQEPGMSTAVRWASLIYELEVMNTELDHMGARELHLIAMLNRLLAFAGAKGDLEQTSHYDSKLSFAMNIKLCSSILGVRGKHQTLNQNALFTALSNSAAFNVDLSAWNGFSCLLQSVHYATVGLIASVCVGVILLSRAETKSRSSLGSHRTREVN